MKKQNLTAKYFMNDSVLNGRLFGTLEIGTVETENDLHKYAPTKYEYNISRRFSDHG